MAFLTQATHRGRAQRQTAIGRGAALLPSREVMRHALLSVVSQATPEECDEGIDWYPAALRTCERWATEYGFSVDAVCGVVAALSPNTSWAENLRCAEMLLRSYRAGVTLADALVEVPHYADAVTKAYRIAAGEHYGDVLGGRKVRSFVANIHEPLRVGPVTVDRHMVDLLLSERGAVKNRILERVGVYIRCAGVIRSVARELGLRPQELQAIAWCAWRRMHDVSARFDTF